MAISYDPKRWAYGNEFTPDIMNHIENGIKAATDEANRIDTAKVDKVNGKGLSTNDYTNADKQKVSEAATTATVTAIADDVDRHAFGSESGSRNLWNEKWENGIYGNENGNKAPSSSYYRNITPIPIKPNSQYRFVAPSATRIFYYGSNHDYLGTVVVDGSFTSQSNAYYLCFHRSGSVYNHDIAIIEGTSGTYEPYIASNAQLTMGVDESEIRDAELQALGWCVPLEMPVKNSFANGILTQYVGRVDLGTMTWSYNDSHEYFASADIGSVVKKSDNATVVTDWVYCNIYTPTSPYIVYYGDVVANNMRIAIQQNTGAVWIINQSYSNASAFKSAMSGKYLYYELSTPITHTVTDMPSQKSMISDAWDDDPSNKVYYVGDLRIDGNRLHECYVQTDRTSGKPSVDTAHWRKTSVDEVIRKVNATVSADSEIINMTRVAYGFDADSIDRSGKYYFRDRVDEYQHLPSDQHNFILESIYADSNRKAQIGFSVNTGKMWYRVASSGGVYNRAWKEL